MWVTCLCTLVVQYLGWNCGFTVIFSMLHVPFFSTQGFLFVATDIISPFDFLQSDKLWPLDIMINKAYPVSLSWGETFVSLPLMLRTDFISVFLNNLWNKNTLSSNHLQISLEYCSVDSRTGTIWLYVDCSITKLAINCSFNFQFIVLSIIHFYMVCFVRWTKDPWLLPMTIFHLLQLNYPQK